MLPGAIPGLKHLLQQGYQLIIITNQYIIGEGFITLEHYERFHRRLLDMLSAHDIEVLDTFFCPHARSADCSCCKPRTGLIRQALQKYPDIDLSCSIFAGDSDSDMACAKAMHIPFYGIGIGPDPIADLQDLARLGI